MAFDVVVLFALAVLALLVLGGFYSGAFAGLAGKVAFFPQEPLAVPQI